VRGVPGRRQNLPISQSHDLFYARNSTIYRRGNPMADQLRKRILTGDRPTGKLHLGHYIGQPPPPAGAARRIRVLLPDGRSAHAHHQAGQGEHPGDRRQRARIVMDHLAIGIDPDKVTFYLQSAVHEIYELQLLLSSLVTVERCSSCPRSRTWRTPPAWSRFPTTCSAIRCCNPPTSSCRAHTWCRWARTTRATSNSRARLRAASTTPTAKSSRSRIPMSSAARWWAPTARPR
jgi:hypothetical protein